ncbi:hypothetical protein BDZ85DRAFT_64891 [Elsinoe ampelina]|uniref:Uncharacterized protein n=1 Tax=Elsinoe ampelina TaxID=302913 RepID=A0A6A6FZN6_9PEZI|nr:hypothetical protein BDZ85DRAFT_64891 [Elsinoe ampelina]
MRRAILGISKSRSGGSASLVSCRCRAWTGTFLGFNDTARAEGVDQHGKSSAPGCAVGWLTRMTQEMRRILQAPCRKP